MPHDAGHHEVVSRFLHGVAVFGGCSEGTADSLENEGEDVAGDENPCVHAGLDAGEFGADFEDDMFEGEVDAGGDEGGGDDQAADLDLETIGIPGVVVEHDATDIA